jgi:hypothetical protein
VHRISHTINEAFEHKKYCTSDFLDVSQAFDKVWHEGLLFKIWHTLPSYFNLLRSYLRDRTFRIKIPDQKSDMFPIQAGVPQGSVLGPILFVLYTSDFPTTNNTTTGTFADDTVILATHDDPRTAAQQLRQNFNLTQDWLKEWRIKINETKSVQITFTLRKGRCPPVKINNVEIPFAAVTKYLGMHMGHKLSWRDHIVKKKKQVELKVK